MTDLLRRRSLLTGAAGAALALTATGLTVPAHSNTGTVASHWSTIRSTSPRAFILAGQHLLNGHGFTTPATGTWTEATRRSIAAASDTWGFAQRNTFGYALLHRMAMDRGEGHTGHVVRALQVLLNHRSGAGLRVDGMFDAAVARAVRTYQGRQGLRVDGRAGLETWGRLMPQFAMVNQMYSGPFSDENCGPTSNVIALVAVGRTPASHVADPNGNRQPIEAMRVSCGLSPANDPTRRLRPYLGSDLHTDLEVGLRSHGASTQRASHAEGIDAARAGRVVILHVHHGALVGGSANYGHYVVACGTDAAGDIVVSDPGRVRTLGIVAYSREHPIGAQHRIHDRSLIIG